MAGADVRLGLPEVRPAEWLNRALQLIEEAEELGQDTTEDEAIHQTMILFEIVFRTEDTCDGVRAVFTKEPPR